MKIPTIEIRDQCPYCGFNFTIDARDITGELHALRCIDCKEKFVVEVVVSVSHTIDGIAGVSSDAVLDRLIPTLSDAADPATTTIGEAELDEMRELLAEHPPAKPEFVAPPPMTGLGKMATPRRNGGLKYSDKDRG